MRSKRIDDRMSADFGSASARTRSPALDLELDPVVIGLPVAEALAQEIRNDVLAAGWNNSGRLANGIHVEQVADGYEIVPPPDRLQDDRLQRAFAHQIPAMTQDVMRRARVKAALMDALKRLTGGR